MCILKKDFIMNYLPSEARYGMPNADQILFNRQFTIGYSYKNCQPRWVLEIINPENQSENVQRNDVFRPDHRIPKQFQVEEKHYYLSGYDKGHLIASANRLTSTVNNSETFLMSNMSPQVPELNRGPWKALEKKVRDLLSINRNVEVYSLSGPVWSYGMKTEVLEKGLEDDILIAIPHFFFKCILAENHRGTFRMYAFLLPNQTGFDNLEDGLIDTRSIESFTGLQIWSNLTGSNIERKKKTKARIWW